MSNWYEYYVGLYAIGARYLQTLPATLRGWITGYGTGGWFSLDGLTATVVAPGGVAPGIAPGALAAGYTAGGAGPAHPPPALLAIPADGTRDARIAVGGAAHSSASPYIHSVVPAGIPVAYAGGPTMDAFLVAWERLVTAAGGGAAFTWPGNFVAPAARLQFLAAAFAETSRDYCQLGAIQTALWLRDGNSEKHVEHVGLVGLVGHVAGAFSAVLPMCAGGTYVPQVFRHTVTPHRLTASPTTWARAKAVTENAMPAVDATSMEAAVRYARDRTTGVGSRRLTFGVKYPTCTPWNQMTALKNYLKS